MSALLHRPLSHAEKQLSWNPGRHTHPLGWCGAVTVTGKEEKAIKLVLTNDR